LEGTEISLHALCDGKCAKLFPTSQDHKRALDGDQGLNTGGMGAYSPTPFLSEGQLAEVGRKILEPWVRGCAAEGILFKGILYPGIMLTKDGPKVLEFNARFGDPETQVYLTRLENDLVEVLEASVAGTLDKVELKWSPMASVCVVMASAGYPGNVVKGEVIRGLDEVAKLPSVKVFHAGTAMVGYQVVTNGGRVLGITALGADVRSAREAAYSALKRVGFDGSHYRRDIGEKGLQPRKVQN
jgi:phosphoribosylamine---glycine ligase